MKRKKDYAYSEALEGDPQVMLARMLGELEAQRVVQSHTWLGKNEAEIVMVFGTRYRLTIDYS